MSSWKETKTVKLSNSFTCMDSSSEKSNVNFRPTVDLFVCNECKVEFDLESKKIKNRPIFCPVCKAEIKAWQKEWET